MLEVILLIVLCRALGKMLRNKGRNPVFFQIMLVVSWIGCELAGGVIAGIVHVVQHGDAEFEPGLSVYVFAIVGAACAAGFWFLVAFLIPSVQKAPPSFGYGADASPTFQPPADPNNPYSSPGSR